MIVQQVNLYQQRFHPVRLWFSAAQLAASLLLVVGAAAIWSLLLQYELGEAEQRSREVVATRDSLTAELQAANSELTALLEDTRLDREIETTARRIAAHKQVLNFVDGNQFGSGQGFSDYLVALSRLAVDDIWLSQVRLAGDFVQIRGSSLDASQISPYFARFGNEAVFRGDHFDLFQLRRDERFDWKVDFEIATRGGVDE